MEVIIEKEAGPASGSAAQIIAKCIHEKPDAVLGLATGSTPLLLYKELIRMHQEEELDFSSVRTFNLDEPVGLPEEHEPFCSRFMWSHLFNHINVKPDNVYIPDGRRTEGSAACLEYEQTLVAAGGIDIQVLGLGPDGHIEFNEPTASFSSRVRRRTVPHHDTAMGFGTVRDARMNLLLAFGEGKAAAVAALVEGPVAAMIPASILQHHACAKLCIDEAAASDLKLSEYYRWVCAGNPERQRVA